MSSFFWMTWREIEAERADVSNWRNFLVFCLLSFWLPSKNTHRKITLQTSATLNGTEWSLFFGSIGRRASDRDIPSIDHGFRNRALTTAKHRDGHRTTLQQSFGKVLSPTGRDVKFRGIAVPTSSVRKEGDRPDRLVLLEMVSFFFARAWFLSSLTIALTLRHPGEPHQHVSVWLHQFGDSWNNWAWLWQNATTCRSNSYRSASIDFKIMNYKHHKFKNRLRWMTGKCTNC